MEDKFAALVQCSSVTCKTTDTIHGVAASNVSENPDGRLTTSSQLADESWAPVAQGHLGARVRSISALGFSPYWCSASPCSQSYLIDPPRVGLGQRWVRYSAPFPGSSKFDLKLERTHATSDIGIFFIVGDFRIVPTGLSGTRCGSC